MHKRLDPHAASVDIVDKIGSITCRKGGECLKRLWGGHESCDSTSRDLYGWVSIPEKGFGKDFVDSVIAARRRVYHSNAYQAQMELKNLLQRDVSDDGIGTQQYKFYHNGYLGDSPAVPTGIRVSAVSQLCFFDYQ